MAAAAETDAAGGGAGEKEIEAKRRKRNKGKGNRRDRATGDAAAKATGDAAAIPGLNQDLPMRNMLCFAYVVKRLGVTTESCHHKDDCRFLHPASLSPEQKADLVTHLGGKSELTATQRALLIKLKQP